MSPVRRDVQKRYDRWWLGKLCRLRGSGEFKRVVKVELIGPPSFVYGTAVLHFEDGTDGMVPCPGFRPRKMDVEVEE